MNKLQVIQTAHAPNNNLSPFKPKTFREQTQARFEREWLQDKEQFDPLRNVKERERLDRTCSFILKHLDIEGMKIADLGAGSGALAKRLRDLGAEIDAVDIAKNALAALENERNITIAHACMPHTHLADTAYDLVICAELIAHLPPREHRLFFNELARVSKKGGSIVFSTSIDIDSEDALDQLIGLMQTELELIDYQLSYHSRYIRLKNLFSMPCRFSNASKKPQLRESELKKRHSIWSTWFRFHSTKVMGAFWSLIAPLSNRIEGWMAQSRILLLFLEKLSHSERSISHIMIMAKKKPLVFEASNE